MYEIAGLRIRIAPLYGETARRLAPFLSAETDCDIDCSVTGEEISLYRTDGRERFAPPLCEGPLILTKLCRRLLDGFDGFFFHSSALMLDGEGYLFTALSGTGKSTHTALWRRHFGDRVTMINDDKPVIRRVDGRFYVFSTPWMGKSDIGGNLSAPIRAIYVLKRGTENRAEPIEPALVLRELLEATLLPRTRTEMETLLDLFNDLFAGVKLFLLHCNMDEEAAQVAYDAACQP